MQLFVNSQKCKICCGYKKQLAEVREQTNGDFQYPGLSLSLTHILESGSGLMACGLNILEMHSFGGKIKSTCRCSSYHSGRVPNVAVPSVVWIYRL